MNSTLPSKTSASSTSPVLKAGHSPNPPIALNDTEAWPTPADDVVKEKKQQAEAAAAAATKPARKPEWVKYEGAEIVYNTPAAGKSARGGDRKGYNKRGGGNRSGSRDTEEKGQAAAGGKHRRAQSVSGPGAKNFAGGQQGKSKAEQLSPNDLTATSSPAADVPPSDFADAKAESNDNGSAGNKNGNGLKEGQPKLSSLPTTPSDRSSSPGNRYPNIQFGTIDSSSSTGPQMSGTHQQSQRSNFRPDRMARGNNGSNTNSNGNHNGVTYRPNARSQSLGHQFFQNPSSAPGGFPIQYPPQPPFANQPYIPSLPPRAHSMSMYGYPAPGMAPMPPLLDLSGMQMALSHMGYYDVIGIAGCSFTTNVSIMKRKRHANVSEYYLSAENLVRDEFLRKHMDSKGFLPAYVPCQFPQSSQFKPRFEYYRGCFDAVFGNHLG